jgi:hypothetical protein
MDDLADGGNDRAIAPHNNTRGERVMSRYEKCSLVITGAGITVAICLLVIYFLQLREMRKAAEAAKKSADTARDAVILGQRPWLGLNTSPALAQKAKQVWVIDFEIQNFGHSPALHSSPNTSLAFAPLSGNLNALIGIECSRGEDWTLGVIGKKNPANPQREDLGYTIFPGVPVHLRQTVGGTKIALTFYGCLTYLDQFADPGDRKAIHHTPYCYNATLPLSVGQKMTPCFVGKAPD